MIEEEMQFTLSLSIQIILLRLNKSYISCSSLDSTKIQQLLLKVGGGILGAEFFAGRNLRGKKLSRDQKKNNAKLLTTTFENSVLWDIFRVKNFREFQCNILIFPSKMVKIQVTKFTPFPLSISSVSLSFHCIVLWFLFNVF